jgi:AcrR family transcriptional regulator
VPKLWTATIEDHRREVTDAVLVTAAAIVDREGLRAVTMSRIASETGIGRATLYRYYPDVESILRAWHERQVQHHLHLLLEARDGADTPDTKLEAVLLAYARLAHGHGSGELAQALHKGPHMTRAEGAVRALLRDLLAEGRQAGSVRTDVPVPELTTFCLHSLSASNDLRSDAAVLRLVRCVVAGIS